MSMQIGNKGLGYGSKPLTEAIDWDNPKNLNSYTMMSANLFNFLPNMPPHRHLSLYQQYKGQQYLNGNDIHLFEGDYPLPIDGLQDFVDRISREKGIIATYHFGPFQLINYILINANIPYVLLVGPQSLKEWQYRYPALMKRMEQAAENNRFQLLNAQQPSSLRKMYRLLDEGYQLLLYIDGMEGIDLSVPERSIQVSYLGQEIRVAKGAATLASYYQLPIYPVLLRRGADSIAVEMDKPIYAALFKDRHTFIQSASDRLFAFLGRFVLHWPEQWTNWNMLHRFLAAEQPFGNNAFLDGLELHECYGLLQLESSGYLLEKWSYKLYPMVIEEFNVLKRSWL